MDADDRARKVLAILRAKVGEKGEERVSLPITLNDIQKWAIAVYWPETPPRQFWDEEFARSTRWGGIIAPAEFNPFAWLISGARSIGVGLQLDDFPSVNAGTESNYGEPMRPGDVIRSNSEIVDVYQKIGSTGALTFCVSEDRWTNQHGEMVRTLRHNIIYR